jgi:FolB domain-containing protein
MWIGIEKLKVRCIIGCLPEERVEPQEIFIDLKVETPLRSNVGQDGIAHTLDYRKLAEVCENCAVAGNFELLEAYVEALINAITALFPITKGWVKVTKPSALGKAAAAYIEKEFHGMDVSHRGR